MALIIVLLESTNEWIINPKFSLGYAAVQKIWTKEKCLFCRIGLCRTELKLSLCPYFLDRLHEILTDNRF